MSSLPSIIACLLTATVATVAARATEINCPKTVAQIARPLFFTMPLSFSDDLMPDVLGQKLGYRWPWREKRRMAPKEIAEQYARSINKSTAPLAVRLKGLLAGRRFVDLGCGSPNVASVPRIVAEALGATEYIGVDIRNKDQIRTDEFGTGGKFTSTFVQRDLSAFLSEEKTVGNTVFYLSGIEAQVGKEKEASDYLSAVKKKLRRLTKSGDAVIIGTGTSNFDSIAGFSRVSSPGIQQRIFMRDPD